MIKCMNFENEIMNFQVLFSHKIIRNSFNFILKIEDHKIHLKILIKHDLKTFKNRIRAYKAAMPAHTSKVEVIFLFFFHCLFSINCKATIIMDGSGERRRTREMTKKTSPQVQCTLLSLTQSFSSPDFLSLSSMLLILSTGKNIFKKEIGWMEQLGFCFNVNFFLPFSFLSLSLTTRSLAQLFNFARKSSHAQVSQPNIQNSFHRMDLKMRFYDTQSII